MWSAAGRSATARSAAWSDTCSREAAKPAAPATFSVPGTSFSSCRPPFQSGRTRVRRRTNKAPVPARSAQLVTRVGDEVRTECGDMHGDASRSEARVAEERDVAFAQRGRDVVTPPGRRPSRGWRASVRRPPHRRRRPARNESASTCPSGRGVTRTTSKPSCSRSSAASRTHGCSIPESTTRARGSAPGVGGAAQGELGGQRAGGREHDLTRPAAQDTRYASPARPPARPWPAGPRRVRSTDSRGYGQGGDHGVARTRLERRRGGVIEEDAVGGHGLIVGGSGSVREVLHDRTRRARGCGTKEVASISPRRFHGRGR